VRRFPFLLMCTLTLASATGCSAQIFHKKKPVDKSTDTANTAEPDKQLYDKAMYDIKKGKHEVGRLGLQTLINTYPDSEYLAKAKLAIADSYFKEGGTANIAQAINGYQDFIVFFPFLPEAAYAQMQVAMCNYNEMAKADRDDTHALAAEEEFQTFLKKYPKDPLAPQAEQHLREVQEVLADGQFRIAYYYYVKGDRRAAAGRLIPLVRRYPLYSKSDTALWMLGDIFEKSERKDVAGAYYGQIVKNYPLSPKAPDARAKLKDFGMPIPQPDPKAVEWMTAEQNTPRPKESPVHKTVSIFHPGPDVHMAAQHGLPQLEPDSSDQGSVDLLSGSKGTTGLVATGAGASASGTSTTGSTGGGVVGVVKPGEPAPAGSATEDPNSPTTSDPASGTATTTESTATTSATDPSAPADASSSATDPSKTDNTQPASSTQSQNASQKESSNKKKGLKKILPW
jgi:outer membrane protein assembly factor BamD